MRLTSLLRYPIKAARAEPLTAGVLEAEGVAGDRRFVVVDASGAGLTQRTHPALATLEARQQGSVLHLRAGARHLNVTIRTSGALVPSTLFGEPIQLVEQGGSEVGAWLSVLLGGGGLGTVLPSLLNRAPPFRLLRAPGAGVPSGSLRRGAGLSDMAPLHLVCEESLAELNARRASAGLPPAPLDRFRPNLVVSGCARAHAEDEWTSVRIGGATLRVSGPCPRCTVPDVAQASGARDGPKDGPMSTLRAYRARGRAGVLFGIYLSPLTPGATVRVGDEVEGMP